MHDRRLRPVLFYTAMLPLLAVSMLFAIRVGSTPIDTSTVWHVLASKLLPQSWTASTHLANADVVIVWLIRLPRVIVAALVGMGLAAAGVILQALFRNPLAEPQITGAGAGAALTAVIAFVTGWSTRSVISVPLAAMAGALVALAVVYLVATREGRTPIATLLLAGIAVSSLLGAVSTLLLSLNIVNWQMAQEILFWTMGGLDSRTWTHVWLCAPFLLLGMAAAYFQANDLDLLQQGEETASALGLNIEQSKRALVLTVAILTGACVAVSGLIGFVGLVIPHGVRLLLGPANRRLLTAAAVAGATFLVLCDLAARTIHPPVELRLGVLTALVGGPVFIWLLVRGQKERT